MVILLFKFVPARYGRYTVDELSPPHVEAVDVHTDSVELMAEGLKESIRRRIQHTRTIGPGTQARVSFSIEWAIPSSNRPAPITSIDPMGLFNQVNMIKQRGHQDVVVVDYAIMEEGSNPDPFNGRTSNILIDLDDSAPTGRWSKARNDAERFAHGNKDGGRGEHRDNRPRRSYSATNVDDDDNEGEQSHKEAQDGQGREHGSGICNPDNETENRNDNEEPAIGKAWSSITGSVRSADEGKWGKGKWGEDKWVDSWGGNSDGMTNGGAGGESEETESTGVEAEHGVDQEDGLEVSIDSPPKPSLEMGERNSSPSAGQKDELVYLVCTEQLAEAIQERWGVSLVKHVPSAMDDATPVTNGWRHSPPSKIEERKERESSDADNSEYEKSVLGDDVIRSIKSRFSTVRPAKKNTLGNSILGKDRQSSAPVNPREVRHSSKDFVARPLNVTEGSDGSWAVW
ncbi:hypothetical protein F5Y17DRAFT_459366 [Xylariaceae sp. FL0594]|nr:hypothetical protein F5Y17DRAFT_459366 [Xylariaceae sp. FL0594]